MTGDTTKRGRPNIVGIDKGIGPLEAQIVRALSELGRPASVREVCERLDVKGYFAYQGVLNCMTRLVEKRILARAKAGSAYQYELLIGLEELTAEVLVNVHTYLDGDLDRVACRLLHIDPDRGAPEIAKLRKRLQPKG